MNSPKYLHFYVVFADLNGYTQNVAVPLQLTRKGRGQNHSDEENAIVYDDTAFGIHSGLRNIIFIYDNLQILENNLF